MRNAEVKLTFFRKGQKYAQQENGALAGMAEMPDMPEGCEDDPDFQAGYYDFFEGLPI